MALDPVPQTTVFNFDSFSQKVTSWARWVNRLETAMYLYNSGAGKRLQLILHYMGAETYDVLCDKLLPQVPERIEYKEIVETLEAEIRNPMRFLRIIDSACESKKAMKIAQNS